jgi:Domain of unknown function (DUF3560)
MTPTTDTPRRTYRERREARAERLRQWAAKRETRAEQTAASVDALASLIPLGQPILRGHHSQRRAERDRDRIVNGTRRVVEHSTKARDFTSRAANIEAAAEHAIYSDDADAIERLEERIAGLESERDTIKAYNAACRKGTADPATLPAASKFGATFNAPAASSRVTRCAISRGTSAVKSAALPHSQRGRHDDHHRPHIRRQTVSVTAPRRKRSALLAQGLGDGERYTPNVSSTCRPLASGARTLYASLAWLR